jgi:hypothetical protein
VLFITLTLAMQGPLYSKVGFIILLLGKSYSRVGFTPG